MRVFCCFLLLFVSNMFVFDANSLFATQYSTNTGTKFSELPTLLRELPELLTQNNEHFNTPFAAGLWALTPVAAKHYGLQLTAEYDERFHTVRATQAALQYLGALHSHFKGDSIKVLQLYAEKAGIELSDSLLKRGLPHHQTLKYYAMQVDSAFVEMTVSESISIADFCRNLSISESLLRKVNPALMPHAQWLRKGYHLYLPTAKYNALANDSAKLYRKTVPEEVKKVELAVMKPEPIRYRVKEGDTLGHIAQQHRVSVSRLKEWNSLKSDRLQIGQRLNIYK